MSYPPMPRDARSGCLPAGGGGDCERVIGKGAAGFVDRHPGLRQTVPGDVEGVALKVDVQGNNGAVEAGDIVVGGKGLCANRSRAVLAYFVTFHLPALFLLTILSTSGLAWAGRSRTARKWA